ncbi:hypothetical protein [Sporosarcina sp. FSL K6-3457]|uniref:hypothetical protein n=1 Tax=Sporosarcina sp. FSL K6-3457 TaxID=2978204 RepID=UPI0030F7741B
MRLLQRDLKPYTVYRRVVVTEPDGSTSEDTDSVGHTIRANVQPAGGKLMLELYGERLAYMLTAYMETGTDILETDRVCIHVTSDAPPDYKVVAVRRWNTHYVVDLEKVRT